MVMLSDAGGEIYWEECTFFFFGATDFYRFVSDNSGLYNFVTFH